MDTKVKEYYLHCGIKSMWHSKTFDDFSNDKDALSAVQKYLDKYKKEKLTFGLFLWGSNGTGKTHLMNCAFKELIAMGQSVRIFSLDEIVDKFTASWYSDEEKMDINNILRNVDVLGIDEFGKNIDKDGNPMYIPDLVKRVVESVIRYRVQMNKPIWFTSNTEPKFVVSVFSEDIASLLREGVVAVCVRGSDFRSEIATRNKRIMK